MAVVRTHRPIWTQTRCLPCGACTQRCPVRVFPELALEKDSLRGQVARQVTFPPSPPPVPPCQAACPLGQDVPAYVGAIARGDFDAAREIIALTNPLPAACARLCVRACMHACVRGQLDAPVEIRALKRAALDWAAPLAVTPPPAQRATRVAVVGAGPAGLAAASALRRRGHQVTIFEAAPEPGGLLRHAVPEFDYPKAALRTEIAAILALGIELACNHPIESEAGLRQLLQDGFGAVLLATGAPAGQRLAIPGECIEGVTDAVSFARSFLVDPRPHLSGPAVVAGAGNLAVSCARLAVRAGAGKVTLVMGRPRAEAPADPDDLGLAEGEGVQILAERRVVEAAGQGALARVRCERLAYSDPDLVGRRLVRQAAGSEWLDARLLIAAEDRRPDLGWLGTGSALSRGALGNLVVDAASYQTSLPGVFGAGEAITGARNTVEAIATGLRAAAAVARFLEGGAS